MDTGVYSVLPYIRRAVRACSAARGAPSTQLGAPTSVARVTRLQRVSLSVHSHARE